MLTPQSMGEGEVKNHSGAAEHFSHKDTLGMRFHKSRTWCEGGQMIYINEKTHNRNNNNCAGQLGKAGKKKGRGGSLLVPHRLAGRCFYKLVLIRFSGPLNLVFINRANWRKKMMMLDKEIAEHMVKTGTMSLQDLIDYQNPQSPYDNMVDIATEVGLLSYVMEEYKSQREEGYGEALSAYLALAHWDLVVIPSHTI